MISLLAAAALAAAQPVSTVSIPSPYFLDNATVVQVSCPVSDGEYLGSAFYIGDGKFITARHVIRDEDSSDKHLFGTCRIADKPITVLDVGKGSVDYALISAPVYPPVRAILSCDGFTQSRQYYATGYASGMPWLVTQRLIGSGSKLYEPGFGNNEDLLRGSSTEGMSGGPVSDTDGVIVGLVSAGAGEGITMEIFLSLADTPLCKVARK